MKTLSLFVLLAASAAPLHAQSIDDGIMMTARSVQAGNVYSRDTWDEYWEGALKRTNGNIGTITTQTNAWSAVYGLQFFLANQVEMPNVSDYELSVGYLKHDVHVHLAYSQQTTHGGGDIRRQDAPFVSHRPLGTTSSSTTVHPRPRWTRTSRRSSRPTASPAIRPTTRSSPA